jgi:two-component system sensor histidine kinase KdpD
VRKHAAAGIGFVAITLFAWLLRDRLTLANFAMIYILVVLVIAIRLGTAAAMVAALISFLSINFLLTEPYYTFIVADTRDVIELFVFIVVAVLSGQLGARARQQAEEAQQRADEQEILYRLTGLMNQANDPEAVYEALAQMMREDLHAREAYVLPAAATDHADYADRADAAADGSRTAEKQTLYLPLLAGGQAYGTLRVVFDAPRTSQQVHLLHACASQAAVALQRLSLAEQAGAGRHYEEADRLKTAILRAVSHDLRTPITIIKTSASNLRTLGEGLPASEREELSEIIETEADHLNKLVGNLLDLSRLQAGALVLNSELNSLEEVAGDVAARVWEMTGRERILMRFPEDMPLVRFDYGLILQALSNLVDNALRYEPAESRIEIQGFALPSQVQIKVINHGERIAPEDRKRIMEPFYRGKNGQIGLGLPIAKGIIEAHHGTLWVEDTPGRGATFSFTLPAADAEADKEDEAENSSGR